MSLSLSVLLSSACAAAAATGFSRSSVAPFDSDTSLPYANHKARFRIEAENRWMQGSNGSYVLPISTIRDIAANDGIVAVYVRRDSFISQTNGAPMGEINLLSHDPAGLSSEIPDFARYGWAYLWGQRLTTIPWLDCCSETGDLQNYSLQVSPDAASVLLTETQIWYPNGTKIGRDAQSQHNFTVRLDPSLGYVVDASLYLRTNQSQKSVELTNWLPAVLANPWPTGQWSPGAQVDGRTYFNDRGSVTLWPTPPGSNVTAPFVGFSENLLAGAMLSQYEVGNFVATVAPGRYSPVLSHSGNYTFLQATCPTWMDQHQMVVYPPANPDGYFVLNPQFRMAFLPPHMSDILYENVELITWNESTHRPGSAVILRLGELEGFEPAQEPVALTQPLRGLVEQWYNSDLTINRTVGFNGSSSSLELFAMSPTDAAQFYAFALSQPLVPVMANTSYTFTAWVLPVAANSTTTVTSYLRCDTFEADDFNVQIRQIGRNSSFVSSPAPWTRLSITFTSPTWDSYADIRFVAIGSGSLFVDDMYFGLSSLVGTL